MNISLTDKHGSGIMFEFARTIEASVLGRIIYTSLKAWEQDILPAFPEETICQ
jgi:hypothetical protein